MHRIFVPPSAMASGIRSATPVVPCGPVKAAIPEAGRTQVSLLVTSELLMALGTLSARPVARPISSAEPPAPCPVSASVALVGEAVGAATAGEVVGTGAGEFGASASDGHTGGSAGILGGTTRTGMPPRLTLTRTTATTGATIRRTVRTCSTTTTRREAIRGCQIRIV